MNETYVMNVKSKSRLRYLAGLLIRLKNYSVYKRRVSKARKHGAHIGEEVVMTSKAAKLLNANFTIGSHTSLHNVLFSSNLHKVHIGSHVIIGDEVKIVRGSHNIDSPLFESIARNEELIIEDYVWLCPNCVIMPSVKKIGYGAVVSANAVVIKDIEPMSVVGGNPAKEIKKRKCVHDELVVESLLGGDYHAYKKARKSSGSVKKDMNTD